jgi:amino acid adenylation domain-containing protein
MPKTVDQGFRLSPQQQHIWWAQRAEPSAAFVVQTRIDIAGALDRRRLAQAVERAVGRHEILRTTFPLLPNLSVPVQSVESTAGFDWSEHSLAGGRAVERGAALGRLGQEIREIPFDFANGPLLRATLVELEQDRYALFLTQPAIAADGVSLDLLATEIAVAYQGRPAEDEVFQYADLAELLHEWQGTAADEPGPAFWRKQNVSALVRVSLGPAGLPDGRPFRPGHLSRGLGRAAIEEAAARLEVPISLVLLAGWHAALHLSTGEEEIVIGTLFDGRTCAELESALGPFARYLPARARSTADSTLAELTRTLSVTLAEISPRQDFFLSQPVERLLAEHGATGWPFGFDHHRLRELPAAPGAPSFATGDTHLGLDRFGLRFSVLDDGRSLSARLAFDTALFQRDEAEGLLDRCSRVLDGLLASLPLGEIDVLTAAERRQVRAFNQTESAIPAGLCAHHLIEANARSVPHAPALAHAGRTWTYAELNAGADRLAHRLRAAGVGPGSLVGLCLERSPALVEAVLGTLKAGAAYVPLDPGYPAERLSFMAEDAGLSLLLTRELWEPLFSGIQVPFLRLTEDAPFPQSEPDPQRSASPADLAYVIYTSGSTGRPKGVMIPHQALTNYLLWARRAYAAGEGAGAPVHSALGFDLTVTSLLVPLAAGTAVTLLDESNPIEALASALRGAEGFSLVKLTPAHLDILGRELDPGEYDGRTRALVIGGEALRGESVTPWREHAPRTRLINEYGPTEATVGCCTYEVAPGDAAAGTVPIGRPIANTRLYVIGRRWQPVPPGAPGELWIGGDGLARGYLGRPGLTAERFVPDPFTGGKASQGGRLYRTGDLVRLRPDGYLEFLGRIDNQIKIRGFRIELGEIEAVLEGYPKVLRAAVMAHDDGTGAQRLVGYVVAADRRAVGLAELRGHLQERLPEFMIPSAFMFLDGLPLNANGKVDRRALPPPDWQHLESAEEFVAPETAAEELLAAVWAEVLGVSRVGARDNFFHLGGDSIRSIVARTRAEKQGVVFSIQQLFAHPVLRDLARVAREGGAPAPAQGRSGAFALLSAADRARLPEGVEDAYPLANLQAGMLFHSELAPESAIYHDLQSVHARAAFAPDRMREAVRQVSLLHPVLRTSFDLASFSESLQLVHTGVSVPFEIHDLRQVPAEEQEATLSEWLRQERRRAFDWTRPPLVAFYVHLRGEASFQFTMSFHHAILDGWSVASLLTDLFQRYALLLRGEATPPDVPFAVTYRDFVALERAAVSSEEARSFWRRMLEGAEPTCLPRLSRPETAPRAEAGVRNLHLRIDPALSEGAQRAARNAGVPLKSLLLAVYLKVASALSGTRDVLIGLASHGRPEQADGERVLGLFLNTLPCRMHLRGGTWRDLVGEVFDLERRMLPFRSFPFAEIQQLHNGHLVLDAVFNYLHYHVYNRTLGVREIEVLGGDVYEETNFPLVIHIALEPFSQNLQMHLVYRTPELGAVEAERFAGSLLRVLTAVVADLESRYDTALLSAAERQQLLREWSDTASLFPREATIHGLFAVEAELRPAAVAVEQGGERLTYSELGQRAARFARRLVALGLRPEERVAVLAERSVDLISALLGIVQAGGAYLPLDPAHPPERLTWLLRDAGASLLLAPVTVSLAASAQELARTAGLRLVTLDEEGPEVDLREVPLPEVPAAALAYVMYTSGSTGVPKGVAVTHRNVVRLVRGADYADFGSSQTWLQYAPVSFDASTLEIWAPLLNGGRLVLFPGRIGSLTDLARVVETHGVTSAWLTAGLFHEMVDGCLEGLRPLRQLLAGGDVVSPEHARKVLAAHPGLTLIDGYGPTEGTTFTCCHPMTGAQQVGESVPIGRPIANARVYVLDERFDPVPVGAGGELFAGGDGLARGYLDRPELTAERFVPDPFGEEAGGRLYRTGDRVRRRVDGVLEFLGRADNQIKLRGFRIELGEIEASLAALAGVREAVVTVREDTPGDRRLVAYVVGMAGDGLTADILRQGLRERLPDSMMPAAYVMLAALPLTPNGKVDRKALPAPERQSTEESYLAPRTPVEEVLAGIWAELLGLERVGAGGNFFDLGGHSLLATRVASRLRGAFGVEMPLRDLFEAPTLADLATRVEAALRTGGDRLAPPLVPVPREGPLPLSFAQQRLWFIDQLEPGKAHYNIPVALRIDGPLNAGVLAQSLGEIVRRHEALRTVFAVQTAETAEAVETGSPVQVIQPPSPFLLPVVDLSRLPESRREAAALTLAGEEAGRPFDLAHGPLLRGVLLRLASAGEQSDHVAALTMHHIVSDGWSMGILVRELTALYAAFAEGRPSPLPELPVQYADFAAWQGSWLRGEVLDSEISFWRQQLAGLPPLLSLPTDRVRPAVQSFRGASRPVRLPADLTRQAVALSRREGATLFMVLLAGFQTLLSRTSGQQDLAVGSPVAGRTRVETEGLIGFFVNTLVLRGALAGEPSFRELLGRVRETALAAHTHQDVPFEKLVQELSPERSLAQAPLFQVMLALQNTPIESLEIENLHLRPVGGAGTTAKFDLTLSLEERDGGLSGTAEYATDLFNASTIDRLLGHFERLLAAAVATPEEPAFTLPLLSPAERGQILFEWNDTGAPAPGACLHELFAAQVQRTPDAIALLDGAREVRYRELDQESGRLAAPLRRCGAGPEVLVGICLERSAGMVAALLAILKTGAAYLPLDPQLPRRRLESLLTSAGVSAVVSHRKLADGLPWGGPVVWVDEILTPTSALSGTPDPVPDSGNDPESLAYVLYTSGSTGMPKGVAVTHRSAVALVRWAGTVFSPGELAGVLAATALSFDLSVFELFVPLSHGGTVILVQNALELAHLSGPAAGRVTLVNTVPSAMAELVRGGNLGASIRTVNLAGEPLPRALADRIYETSTVENVWNLYGPSEDTTYSTAARIPRNSAAAPVIGRPIKATRAYVLAAGSPSEPVPVTVAGELYLGGAGLARGYLHRPELTAERFLPDPFSAEPGARLYRTGDLTRWTVDGDLEFLGRIDQQVKIRGFRIELGEVEAVLAALDGVREAVVVVREDTPGDRRLVAYVAGEPSSLAAGTLRQGLRERLPEYMVPAAFVTLDALPLSANGKVDRKALQPPTPALRPDAVHAAPRDVLELRLAQLWEEVLGQRPVGIRDDFFALGGHSLLAVHLIGRIERILGRRLPVASLFQGATVERVAASLRAAAAPAGSLVPIQPLGSRPPLFWVHGAGGTVFSFLDLARHLGPDQPFYGLQAPGLAGEAEAPASLEIMAALYLDEIRKIQPGGPYHLGGWSLGGVIAFEMAQQLRAQGHSIASLVLLDSQVPGLPPRRSRDRGLGLLSAFARNLGLTVTDPRRAQRELRRLGSEERLARVLAEVRSAGLVPESFDLPDLRRLWAVFQAGIEALALYRPRPYPGRITLFQAAEPSDGEDPGWELLAAGGLVAGTVPGDHFTMLREPNVGRLAEQIRTHLEPIEADGQGLEAPIHSEL